MARPRSSSRKRTSATAAIHARQTRGFGWVPDLPDHRDFMYAAPRRVTRALPKRVDLRPSCPPVYDQGNLGSCTANAIAGALEFDQIKQEEPDVFSPSRLFIYYAERVIEGTVADDSGAMIRDGIKSVSKIGAPHETLWPYAISKFASRPPAVAFSDAKKHRAVSYQRLTQDLEQCKGCLADGYPFVFGFSVYESFESPTVARTGTVPMPQSSERLLGGHAVMCVGYDDSKRVFFVRNSWGTSWGMDGYCTMPMAYVLSQNLADDLWTVRSVE